MFAVLSLSKHILHRHCNTEKRNHEPGAENCGIQDYDTRRLPLQTVCTVPDLVLYREMRRMKGEIGVYSEIHLLKVSEI